jgi:carbonic anhydrase/acetyltransferase-like protein (isoleucine patch superfamily)
MGDHTSFRETWSRHRKLMNLYNKRPVVAVDTFVAPNASVIGDVNIGDKSSVWYGAVIRGDVNKIQIGSLTNIQDRVVVHASKPNKDGGFPTTTTIGDYVTIGHGAVLSSCVIENNVLIGPNALILDGALVESNSIVEPGSVVPPGRRIPSGQVWSGNPATYLRDADEDEAAMITKTADAYADVADKHATEFLPYGTAYLDEGTYVDPYAVEAK